METLFIKKAAFEELYFLEDVYGNLIGRFNSEQEVIDWCKENSYKWRKV